MSGLTVILLGCLLITSLFKGNFPSYGNRNGLGDVARYSTYSSASFAQPLEEDWNYEAENYTAAEDGLLMFDTYGDKISTPTYKDNFYQTAIFLEIGSLGDKSGSIEHIFTLNGYNTIGELVSTVYVDEVTLFKSEIAFFPFDSLRCVNFEITFNGGYDFIGLNSISLKKVY